MKFSIFYLCLFLFPSALVAQQSYTIRGTVVDENGKPLTFASIFLLQSKKGTVSNSEGNFLLDIKTENDILTVSYLGYETFSEKITPQTKTLKIQLKQSSIQLEEVTVNSISAQDLLKSAINKIPDNYEQTPFLSKTYYRGKALENGEIIYIQEAALDIIKSYKKGSKDNYFLIKNRNFRFNPEDDLTYRGIGGQYDYVGNANKEFNNKFFRDNDISYLSITTFDNRQVHVLSACLKKSHKDYEKRNYEMKIYIDSEDLAFVRFDYKRGNIAEISAQYKKIGEKYFLINGRQVYTKSIMEIYKDELTRRVIYGESNMITTDIIHTFSKKDIKGASVNNEKYLETYPAQPKDTLFWKEHYGILPDSTVSKAIQMYEEK